VTIDKFDPNPILININKLKPYWFQDSTTSKGLESTIESGRDTTVIKTRFNITILKMEHAQNFHFWWMEPKTKIRSLKLKTKIKSLKPKTKIW
jgi:hypothetical protein